MRHATRPGPADDPALRRPAISASRPSTRCNRRARQGERPSADRPRPRSRTSMIDTVIDDTIARRSLVDHGYLGRRVHPCVFDNESHLRAEFRHAPTRIWPRWSPRWLGAAGLAGCAADSPADGRLQVVVGFYPLQFVAEQVGGDRVSVTNLAQPGAEPHDLELSPRQVAGGGRRRPGALPRRVPAGGRRGGGPGGVGRRRRREHRGRLIAGGATHAHDEETGEHADAASEPRRRHATRTSGSTRPGWPRSATRVGQRLAELDPDRGGRLPAPGRRPLARRPGRARPAVRATALADCQRREIVTSHAAFGYLAQRYDLEQIGITGLSPEVEPTPQRLAEVAAARPGSTAPPRSSSRRWSARGWPRRSRPRSAPRTAVLDPIEGLPAGSPDDYLSVMRTNLDALTAGAGLPVTVPVVQLRDGRGRLRRPAGPAWTQSDRARRRGGRHPRRQRLRQVHPDPRHARPGAARRRAGRPVRRAGVGPRPPAVARGSATCRSGSARAAACRPPSARWSRPAGWPGAALRPASAGDRAAVAAAHRPGRAGATGPTRRWPPSPAASSSAR